MKIPAIKTLQRAIGSQEFIEWQAYLELEPELFHAEHYYWAQIARAVWCAAATHDSPVRNLENKDFLLKFTTEPVAAEGAKEDNVPAWKRNKAVWLGAFGIAED